MRNTETYPVTIAFIYCVEFQFCFGDCYYLRELNMHCVSSRESTGAPGTAQSRKLVKFYSFLRLFSNFSAPSVAGTVRETVTKRNEVLYHGDVN